MKSLTIKNVYKNYNKFSNKEITVSGWLKTIRNLKNVGFLNIFDGTIFKNLQIVFDKNLSNFEKIKNLNIGSAIIITGKVLITPDKDQPFEIKASKIDIEGLSDKNYPIQKKYHTYEYLRNFCHLRARTNVFQSVFRIRSLLAFSLHEFFRKNDFLYVHTPIITNSDCEGAGEMFKVTTLDMNNIPKDKNKNVDYSQDFFGNKTFLSVSGQLEGETFAQAFKRIYTFGPTFRAEESNTTRHAAEFWMIEPEVAFCDLNEIMDIAESMLKYSINYIFENAADELEFLNNLTDNKNLIDTLKNVANSSFDRITYEEAVNILKKEKDTNFKYKIDFGFNLQTEHEKYLTEKIFKKPIFVINYPKEIKAFYMKLNPDNRTVAAMDCLVPGIGEIMGGSQREENIDKLKKRIEELKLNQKEYENYFDLRRYGSTIHSGYGLGFERFVMYITGMKNIRDVLPYPRTLKSCK